MNIEDSCISCIDTDWSYQLARRMEKEKTNPVLGYRTAGSAAETATGDMLYREMKAIGLTDVTRDTFSLDGWEFEKAVLKFTDDSGQEHTFQMGGYQTNFETDGFEDYELVYLGKGTAADYEGINVKGKLVMVEINQRDEWWISFPVYQAYLRGAAALIAVQANGYGEIAESALNAQDIAGPDFAPAFSLSQADARILKRALRNKISACENNTTDSEDTHNTPEQDAALLRRFSLKVSLDARSRVIPDTTAGNITGKIQGTETDSMILLSAHYDSYFDGFQDDNAAVAMMLGIARALVMEPEFIVADEPISALDVSIRAQVLNLLNELKKKRNLTYLFIAHDLSVVRFISDRIGVIYKGSLVELAPSEELFAHPLHPYTQSLLRAIPMPDPALRLSETSAAYDPSVHDYREDKPAWTEILPGHFVYANKKECDEYRRALQ